MQPSNQGLEPFMRLNPPYLGSLALAVDEVPDQVVPLLQLNFGTAARQNGPQATLAKRLNFQRCWRMDQAILNLIRQLQQVQDLCDSSPRKTFSCRDSGLCEPVVRLELFSPEDGQLIWMYPVRGRRARWQCRLSQLGGDTLGKGIGLTMKGVAPHLANGILRVAVKSQEVRVLPAPAEPICLRSCSRVESRPVGWHCRLRPCLEELAVPVSKTDSMAK